MPARPAYLPDPIVGLGPDALDVLDRRQPTLPVPSLQTELHAHLYRDRDFTVDVQLELLGGGVPDPHWPRALVSGQLVDLELGQPPPAAHPVHNLHLGRVAGDDAERIVGVRLCLLGVADT